MEEESVINKKTMIFFIIFTLLLVILFFVITNTKDEKISSYMGRYISNASIDSSSLSKLNEFGITTRDLKYELIIGTNQRFVLYIDSINDTIYTGEYTKSMNKFNLNIQRIYNVSSDCYNKSSSTFEFKSENKTLVTSDINGNNMLFTKFDEDLDKYDEVINKIVYECGARINY